MDLDTYLVRIGFSGQPGPDLQTLRELHYLHPQAIPFENLSTLLDEGVPLDLSTLEDKLVRRRRGGYCFEHNALFRGALERIGFVVRPLAARVVWNPAYENPRTHMLLLVALDGTDYIADVGFGGATLTAPLVFSTDGDQSTPHETFRIRLVGGEYEVGVLLSDGWRPMYQFDLQAQRAIDYEALNFYVASHPASQFRSHLMAGRATATGRLALGDRQFTRYENGRIVERRNLGSGAAIAGLLAGEFGIAVPEGAATEALMNRIAGSETV